MPSPSRKFYDPIEEHEKWLDHLEQREKLLKDAEEYAEKLIRRGHCPICLTVNCSGHGISDGLESR